MAISITSGQRRPRPVFATSTAIDRSNGSWYSSIAARIRAVHSSSSASSSASNEFPGMLSRSVLDPLNVPCNCLLAPNQPCVTAILRVSVALRQRIT